VSRFRHPYTLLHSAKGQSERSWRPSDRSVPRGPMRLLLLASAVKTRRPPMVLPSGFVFSNATIEHVAYELYSVRLAAQFAGRGFVQLGIADSVDDRHWG